MDNTTISIPVRAGHAERAFLEAARSLANRAKIPGSEAIRRTILDHPTMFSDSLVERGIITKETAAELSEGRAK